MHKIKVPIEYIDVQGGILSDNLLLDLKNVTSSSDSQDLSENDISINVMYERT